ncbi:MAG: DEAD/DEAH box helicase, partial [Pseudomonadota bacterium]
MQWQARLGLYGIPSTRLLPSGLSPLYEDASPETVALSDRIGALRALVSGEPCVIIATPQAALERTLPDDVLRESFVEIRVGQEADVVEASDRLKKLGYEPAEPVRVPGQFSKRGGILDVYPMGGDRPVRIEFFGDLVEGIRTFDPTSQRSINRQDVLIVAPTRETLLPTAQSGVEELVERALLIEADALNSAEAKNLEELIRSDLKAMSQRVFFDRLDLYRPLTQPESACALDLIPENGLLVLDEALEIDAVASRGEDELAQALEARQRRGEILKASVIDFMLSPSHFGRIERTLSMEAMGGQPNWFRADLEISWNAQGLHSFRSQPAALTQALTNWLKSGVNVILATDQPMRAKSMLGQVEIFPNTQEPEDTKGIPEGLTQADGNPAGGFILEGDKFALITDHELFGVGRLKLPQRKFSDGVPITTVLDLKPGDYVVHINFGIGVFAGLVKRVVEGVEKEFLLIEYKAPDRLFVPADQLDRVQKYLSPGDQPPKINRLSGGDWQKAVGKAREEAREFARDLIRLYAERMAVKRESHGPDTPWQSEMEHTFPWVETPSQMQAILDTKEDLELDYPMDRLVCGDVGFGKTEVAIRAAFKVALGRKQVVVLCPTTILSEQHYRSFCERLSPFPTNLALLNRFVSGADRRDILKGVADGEIDILIGTHALLSEQVQFKDLGLLIIDEEQKFGVKHKEALKKLRVNVDVLSMSATPIPRTLSMAMMNIRQMSLINDPPPGRLPVRTIVRPHATDVV